MNSGLKGIRSSVWNAGWHTVHLIIISCGKCTLYILVYFKFLYTVIYTRWDTVQWKTVHFHDNCDRIWFYTFRESWDNINCWKNVPLLICSRHFKHSCYSSENKLKKSAFPTLFPTAPWTHLRRFYPNIIMLVRVPGTQGLLYEYWC